MREYGSQAVVWQTAINPVVALELLADRRLGGTGVLGPEAFDAVPVPRPADGLRVAVGDARGLTHGSAPSCLRLSGSQPGGASSKPSKSNAGATMQPTSVQARAVGPPATRRPGRRPAGSSPATTSDAESVDRGRRLARRAQTETSMGSPAENCQISSASTRCQCDRSPAASRYRIALARRPLARRRPAPATSRRTSRPRDAAAAGAARRRRASRPHLRSSLIPRPRTRPRVSQPVPVPSMPASLYRTGMCRSIKTLRRAETAATTGELEAAARQFVRKISGYRDALGPQSRGVRGRHRRDRGVVAAAARDARRRRRGRPGPLDAGLRLDAVIRTRTRTSKLRGHRRRVSAGARAPWWIRPGLDVVTAGSDRRPGRRGAGARARHAAVRLRPRPLRRERPPAPGRAGRRRPGVPPSGSRSRPTRSPRSSRSSAGSARPATPESVGIDACSPGEVEPRARVRLAARRDQLHRHERLRARPRRPARAARSTSTSTPSARSSGYGRRAPGTRIGIRIDPGAGAGYNEHLEYAGDRPTKFGIDLERLDDAIAAAARHDLTIDTVHFHAGSGWLGDGLAGFERALAAPSRRSPGCAPPAIRSPRSTSAAGSACRPAQDERPVDLDAYAAALARHLGPLGVTVGCEPGDHLGKDAGDPPRRGGDGRDAARRHVRRARHRLERQLLVLHLPVRAGDRRLPRGRRGRGPRWSRSPGTSTRPAMSSPRTTRCRRSRRATSSPSSTPAATTRR